MKKRAKSDFPSSGGASKWIPIVSETVDSRKFSHVCPPLIHIFFVCAEDLWASFVMSAQPIWDDFDYIRRKSKPKNWILWTINQRSRDPIYFRMTKRSFFMAGIKQILFYYRLLRWICTSFFIPFSCTVNQHCLVSWIAEDGGQTFRIRGKLCVRPYKFLFEISTPLSQAREPTFSITPTAIRANVHWSFHIFFPGLPSPSHRHISHPGRAASWLCKPPPEKMSSCHWFTSSPLLVHGVYVYARSATFY